MLIRSQDGLLLVNVNEVVIKVIQISDDKFHIIAYGVNRPDDDAVDELGVYSTKEKAIKVLNDISLYYKVFSRKSFADCSSYAIYEMKQDDELR